MAKFASDEVRYINPLLAQWAVAQGTRALATFAILQGLNIILAGEIRWTAPAFQTALLLPGAPPTWGWVLLAAGSLVLFGSLAHKFIPIIVGGWMSCVWCFFFALSFVNVAVKNPEASTTGVFAYGTFAVLFVGVAIVYMQARKLHYGTTPEG